MYKEITIREAKIEDAGLILGFIQKLAVYEKLEHEVVNSVEQIQRTLFSKDRVAYSLIGEIEGEPRGFAVYFFNYSTFLGKPGLYIEDLFVDPDTRGNGLGLTLFKALAQKAIEKNCGRMEWSVLNWNQPAIDFYKKLGAKGMTEWSVYRLKEDEIREVVKEG